MKKTMEGFKAAIYSDYVLSEGRIVYLTRKEASDLCKHADKAGKRIDYIVSNGLFHVEEDDKWYFAFPEAKASVLASWMVKCKMYKLAKKIRTVD